MLDRDDVADAAGVDEPLHDARVGRVAQDVADGEDVAVPPHLGDDAPARLGRRGHRLLEEDVVAERRERLHARLVVGVLRADGDAIRDAARGGGLLPRPEDELRRDAVLARHLFAMEVARLRDGDDPRLAGDLLREIGVDEAAAAGADDEEGERTGLGFAFGGVHGGRV